MKDLFRSGYVKHTKKIIIISPAEFRKLKKKNPVFLGHIIYISQPPSEKENASSDWNFLIKLITNMNELWSLINILHFDTILMFLKVSLWRSTRLNRNARFAHGWFGLAKYSVCLYKPSWFFYYFITIQWALDNFLARPVQERCGTLWFVGMIHINLISHTYFSLSNLDHGNTRVKNITRYFIIISFIVVERGMNMGHDLW